VGGLFFRHLDGFVQLLQVWLGAMRVYLARWGSLRLWRR
jgi:hypothetical protein